MHHHAHIARKIKGFTLIELMIVMAIVALLMAMVGPLAIKNVEKAQAKQEELSFKNWLRFISYQSYSTGQALELSLNGKQAHLFVNKTEQLLYLKEFEFLFFQPQVIYFNNKGFASPYSMTFGYRQSVKEINIKEFINDSAIKNPSFIREVDD